MGKIPDNELKELARIYNEKGKKEMYALLVEKYRIKNPTCVFNRMCKKPELAYDKKQKCFFAEPDTVRPEDVFMSMDELCMPKTPIHQKSKSVICEQNRNEAMEKLIRELIGDRLLVLRRYVALDYASKIMYVDESSLKNDGYQLLIH